MSSAETSGSMSSLYELMFDGRTSLGEEDFPRPHSLLDRVSLSTPLYPHPHPGAVEIARHQLLLPPDDLSSGTPLPPIASALQGLVVSTLLRYVEADTSPTDRLYILEFQGQRQYLKFGHTRNLAKRLRAHINSAAPHGYALLQGWISPAFDDAHSLEKVVIDYASHFFWLRSARRL